MLEIYYVLRSEPAGQSSRLLSAPIQQHEKNRQYLMGAVDVSASAFLTVFGLVLTLNPPHFVQNYRTISNV